MLYFTIYGIIILFYCVQYGLFVLCHSCHNSQNLEQLDLVVQKL